MAYFKNKYGTYSVQVDAGRDPITGKRKRYCGTTKNLREAKKLEHEFELKTLSSNVVPTDLTLAEFVESFFWKNKSHLRGNTIRYYRSTLKRCVFPRLGNSRIGEITTAQIQEMINGLPTYKEAKSARETLRVVLETAKDLNIIEKNSAVSKSLKYPRKPDVKEYSSGEWVTHFEDHKRILDCAKETASDSVYAMLILGLCFGLRKGEILGIEWKDLDFKNKELNVKRTYVYVDGEFKIEAPKTPESVRAIPMSDYAYRELKKLRKAGGVVHSGPIILGEKSKKRIVPSCAQVALQRWREKNNMPGITLASMRHSFATASIMAGMDVAIVSRWLGHTNVSTTLNKYVKPIKNDITSSVDIINEIYAKAK